MQDEDVSVVVVDDQAPFRLAARSVLRRAPGFALVGEAADGDEAVVAVEEHAPQLVLMDINMPRMNGIEATRRIVGAHPEVVVILCSTYTLADLPSDAVTSGARGYVNKEDMSPQTLARLWEQRDEGFAGVT